MKKQSEKPKPSRGRADLKRLREMDEAEILRTSPKELTGLPNDFWEGAEVVSPQKEAISLRVNQDVLEWFRNGGPRYQSRMNAVLRSYVTSMKRRKRRRSGTADEPEG